MANIISWKADVDANADAADALDARGDHTLSVRGDSKLRKALQVFSGLQPTADGTWDWPLDAAGKVLGEAAGLDADARELNFLAWSVSARALDRVGGTLTSAGLFDNIYESLPQWQARVQLWLAEEALDSEKVALTLGPEDFFATASRGENLPHAPGAPAQNWALELTWGGEDFGVARDVSLGGSGDWLSAAPAFDFSYTLGKRYVTAHFAAKGDVQLALRKYAEIFGDEAEDKSEVAYNVAANHVRAPWPAGMDEMSAVTIARRIALKLRRDISAAPLDEQKKLFCRRPQGVMALNPTLAAGLAGASPAAIPALVCTLAKVFNINSDSFFDMTSAVEERLRKGSSAPPRNEGQSPSSWVQAVSDEAAERKRERDDAPVEASKHGRVDGGGSSSTGGGLSRAFVAHLQEVKASEQYIKQRSGLLEYNKHLSIGEAGYSQHGMLELVLTGKPPIEIWDKVEVSDVATGAKTIELTLPKGYAKNMQPLPLFHMYFSGKLDPLVNTPELEFIVPVLNERTLAKLLALVAVRIYYPNTEVPSCLVNMELTELAKAFMAKGWRQALDFPNQLDLIVNCTFSATAPLRNTNVYGDMLQLMRCSEAATACLRLFGFTDEKLSFTHAFQVIFGVSMLHGGNSSQSRAIFEQQASKYMLTVIEEACERYNLVRHGNTPKKPLVAAFVQKGARSENALKEWLQNADRDKIDVRASASMGKLTGTTATPCTAMAADVGPGQGAAMRQAEQSSRQTAIAATKNLGPFAATATCPGNTFYTYLDLAAFGLSDSQLAELGNKRTGMFDLSVLRAQFNTRAGRQTNAPFCPAYALVAKQNLGKTPAGKNKFCYFGCPKSVHDHMMVNDKLTRLSINDFKSCWKCDSATSLTALADH